MVRWKIAKKDMGRQRKNEVILKASESRMDIVARMDRISIEGAREFILQDTELNYAELPEDEK